MIEIELFDGTILAFPEGTSDEVIDRVAREQTAEIRAQQQPQIDPAQPEAAPQRTLSEMLYENVIGSGEVDTFGERAGELIRGTTAAVARGMADVPALPANLAQLGAAGIERLFGMEDPSLVSRALAALPDTRDMLAAVPVIGEESQYVAPGRLGQFASTAGEFAGGAGLATGPRTMLRYGAAPGVASEGAGQLTEGTMLEPYARTGAALGAGLLATTAPTRYGRGLAGASDDVVEMAEYLAQRGVRPTAGQVSDSPTLMALEGTGGPTGSQLDDFTRAAMQEAGSTATRATPQALRTAQTDITRQMNSILGGTDVAIPPALGQRTLDVAQDFFGGTAGANLPVALRRISDGLTDIATQPGASTIPATQLRQWRTTLGTYTTSNDELIRDAAHALREVIDEATEATLNSLGRADDVAALGNLRTQYRNFLTISDAATRGGRQGARGIISPERLSTAIARNQGRQNYATGRGTDLATLARYGQAIIGSAPATLPQGVRNTMSTAFPFGTAAAGTYFGNMAAGPIGALAGGAAGLAAPAVGQSLMRSGLAQSIMSDPRNLSIPVAGMLPGLLQQIQ